MNVNVFNKLQYQSSIAVAIAVSYINDRFYFRSIKEATLAMLKNKRHKRCVCNLQSSFICYRNVLEVCLIMLLDSEWYIN